MINDVDYLFDWPLVRRGYAIGDCKSSYFFHKLPPPIVKLC